MVSQKGLRVCKRNVSDRMKPWKKGITKVIRHSRFISYLQLGEFETFSRRFLAMDPDR